MWSEILDTAGYEKRLRDFVRMDLANPLPNHLRMPCVPKWQRCDGIANLRRVLADTPLDWFSKRQNQVEMATYISEFMVALQGVELLIGLHYTLHSFGVPFDGAWLFGDDETVVNSSTIPHLTLGKCWNALSYHFVREVIAGGWLSFEHIPRKENRTDMLTKPLGWSVLRQHVEPLLLSKGDTDNAPSGSWNP